jgi:hypothetical protein
LLYLHIQVFLGFTQSYFVMKKFCLLFLVAASFGISAQAVAQQGPDLRAQATEATRKLAQQIALDDAHSMQVRRLTYERLVQEAEVSRQYADDAAMRQNKLRVIGAEYGEKLKTILSVAQYQRYAALAPAAEPGMASTPTAARP